jgi:hypothetical protein
MKQLIIILSVILFIVYAGRAQTVNPIQQKRADSERLKKMVGKWLVTMSLRPTPDAAPLIQKGLVADRSMVGDFCLNESMHPGSVTKIPAFQRISDLAYNVNENRWDYMSVDTRITAGIMYFMNFESNQDSITSYIISFPYPGFGPDLIGRGQAVYSRNVIIKIDDDHDIVKQYWRLTDKPEWLAVQYEYTRQSNPTGR